MVWHSGDTWGDCVCTQVLGLGITNQRETTLVWSRSTGQPLYNAIVWLDNRTRCVVGWGGGLGRVGGGGGGGGGTSSALDNIAMLPHNKWLPWLHGWMGGVAPVQHDCVAGQQTRWVGLLWGGGGAGWWVGAGLGGLEGDRLWSGGRYLLHNILTRRKGRKGRHLLCVQQKGGSKACGPRQMCAGSQMLHVCLLPVFVLQQDLSPLGGGAVRGQGSLQACDRSPYQHLLQCIQVPVAG